MENDWINNKPFSPIVGKCYQLSFGHVTYAGKEGHWVAYVKIVEQNSCGWIDLDTDEPIDPEILRNPIAAFREIAEKQ